MTGRKVKEWVGKTPDSKVPPKVRQRVLEAYGRRCYLSDRPINVGDKWEIEHKLALSLGGENRETNLAPALVAPHKEKTKADRKKKAKIDRVHKKHFGMIKKRSSFATSRGGKFKQKVGGQTVLRSEE